MLAEFKSLIESDEPRNPTSYLIKLERIYTRIERALSAQGEAVRHLADSPEDRFEQFVQAEIARSPEPLRELGEYLADALDEDKFPRANALLLQLATSYTHPAPAQAAHPDDIAVDRFAAAMKDKLAAARAKGRGGWDDKEDLECHLSNLLRAHVEKGDPRDVANFCCFLWNRGESIQPATARVTDAAVKAVGSLKEMRERWIDAAEGYGMQGIIYADQLLRDATDEIDSVRAALTAALEADHG